jgi:hypothetical protein
MAHTLLRPAIYGLSAVGVRVGFGIGKHASSSPRNWRGRRWIGSFIVDSEKILAELSGVKRTGGGWTAKCPAHDDQHASLSIATGRDGRTLLHCHAGCTAEQIVAALGLTLRDLMSETIRNQESGGNGNERRGAGAAFPTAGAALAELDRRHGPHAALWTYRNAAGEPVGLVVRWDRQDGKDIRPIARMATGWVIGAMPARRPLYRLPEISSNTAARLWIVEGEKAAEAGAAIGLLTTTTAGGARAARFTDWSPLAGRDVVILPDNDDAGSSYADDVIVELGKLRPPPIVRIVELPNVGPHGDLVDFAEQHDSQTAEDIVARINGLVAAVDPIDPTPTQVRVERYRPFPVEALPEPIRSFVAAGAAALGCDVSYVGVPLLGVLAAAIGTTRRIELRRGWSEQAIVWAVIVGESGTLKTPAFRLVVNAVRELQAQRFAEHQKAREEHESAVLRYETELTAWRRQASKADYGVGDPPIKPAAPQATRYIVSDTTLEALAPILQANPRGVLLARDELAAWVGSFDRYAQTRGGDAPQWLSMHNAEMLVVDRKGGGTVFVPSAAVSVIGSIQPRVLDRVLASEHREDGLLARLLLAMPPTKGKRWTEAVIPEQLEREVETVVQELYKLGPHVDEAGDARPRLVSLDAEAKKVWVGFYNRHAAEQVELDGDLAAAWSKLEGYAARLALVVHCVRMAAGDLDLRDLDVVDVASVEAGVALANWFGDEARRVYAILAEDDQERDRRDLVAWIERHDGKTTIRDLSHGPRRYRGELELARAALNQLVEDGVGRWLHSMGGAEGGRPSTRFELLDTGTGGTGTKTPTGDSPRGGYGAGATVQTVENAAVTPSRPDDWGEI